MARASSSVSRRAAAPAADETPALVCAYQWCNKPLVRPATGRPPKYCGDDHRKAAERQRRIDERAEADRIKRAQRLEEEHRERVLMASRICVAAGRNPSGFVDVLVDYMEREVYGYGPSRESQLWSLDRFIARQLDAPVPFVSPRGSARARTKGGR